MKFVNFHAKIYLSPLQLCFIPYTSAESNKPTSPSQICNLHWNGGAQSIRHIHYKSDEIHFAQPWLKIAMLCIRLEIEWALRSTCKLIKRTLFNIVRRLTHIYIYLSGCVCLTSRCDNNHFHCNDGHVVKLTLMFLLLSKVKIWWWICVIKIYMKFTKNILNMKITLSLWVVWGIAGGSRLIIQPSIYSKCVGNIIWK